MVRIAAARDTFLTPAEIAAEALRQFDQGEAEPSIRGLAAELRVAPTSIYYHFPSRAAIFHAAVELVWKEAVGRLLELHPNPFEADPTEVLVASGLATRRAWLSHYRIARYMTATPEANEFITNALGLMATVFERLDLQGEQAAAAFHSYSSFMLGAVLFAAERKTANEQLADAPGGPRPRFRSQSSAQAVVLGGDDTRVSLDRVMDISIVDPERDEELFEQGLRRLIESLTAT
jgi:AcrR family transcriptional regulator